VTCLWSTGDKIKPKYSEKVSLVPFSTLQSPLGLALDLARSSRLQGRQLAVQAVAQSPPSLLNHELHSR